MLIASVILISQPKDKKFGGKEKTESVSKIKGNNSKTNGFYFKNNSSKKHSKQNLNCKTCHNCEYPTKADPCLTYCPREGMITVNHTPDECPEVITLDEMSTRFGAVVFSHKLHAQMSEMSNGCQGCHHFNTTGPVLACRKCHEQSRIRENIKKIDLKGAYHRQCMNCHRQWSHTTDCNSCHLPKTKDVGIRIQEKVRKITGKEHPSTVLPNKRIFETVYNKGKLVTFYHEDHIKLFNISCNSCHRDENCIKCHDYDNKLTHSILENQKKQKVHFTLDEHHKLCQSCHKQNDCKKCHSDKVLTPWSHDKATRFALKHYHEKLSCEKCHSRRDQFENLNIECRACHKHWKLGNFNHKVTGFILSENHIELECDNCHTDMKFIIKPACSNCHDDKSFPKDMPGKMKTNIN